MVGTQEEEGEREIICWIILVRKLLRRTKNLLFDRKRNVDSIDLETRASSCSNFASKNARNKLKRFLSIRDHVEHASAE